MGFLSKIFRRKKGESKKGRKNKNKDSGLLHEVDRRTPVAPVTQQEAASVRREGSFANTLVTARGSNSSKENETSRNGSFAKHRLQSSLGGHRKSHLNGAMAGSEKPRTTGGRDDTSDRSNGATSPRLSYQQLQQFERQQQHANGVSPSKGRGHPVYTMSGTAPKGQMNAMDDMNRSDASSSSFNLSTDAEDSEYEHLRRRGVLPGTNSSTLDTSTISAVSSPTTYTTDDDRIFPALQTDDDMTQATAPSTKESPPKQPQGLLVPLSNQEEEPGQIQIFPMKLETEDDLRAWTFSPSSTQTSKEPTSNKSSNSQSRFGFQSAERALKPMSMSPTAVPPSSTTSRNTPGAHRSFTSPRSQDSSNTDVSTEFGNFADFSNFPGSQPWNDGKTDPKPSPRANGFRRNFDGFDATPRSQVTAMTPSSQQDKSLTDLLAQAKSKSRRSSRSNTRVGRGSTSSVNSAPAMTASFLRQQHNLRSSNGGHKEKSAGGPSQEGGATVSDIILSLEATNHSRMKPRSGHGSVGDIGALSTAKAAKERLREKRRRDREGLHRSRSSEASSSENSDNEASESWLFDEVTGALGPRGIAADLESLSGRSNRSNRSNSNRSHKSHRSRSHKSRKSSSRRHRSSGDSVDSRGSRHSRSSKNSRYSHRSTKSYLSQMSEQSRSVANDLLRLEMQLAMVGSQENRDDVPVRGSSSASIGGASKASRASRKSLTSHQAQASTIARRTKATVVAPPGKLGIILANKADSKGTVVSGVRTSSVLAEKISPGDRIIAIDGEDVSRMTVSEITTIMSRKADYERTLSVLTTQKQLPTGAESSTSGAIAHQHPHYNRSSPVKAGGMDSFDKSFSQYRR